MKRTKRNKEIDKDGLRERLIERSESFRSHYADKIK